MYGYPFPRRLFLGALFITSVTAQTHYVFSKIDAPFPGTVQTLAYGINAHGDIVGNFVDANGDHGFLLKGGEYTAFDVPFAGATETIAFGVNSRDEIVGRYDVNGQTHGFLLKAGTFTALDAPCPNVVHTLARGINDAGQIVGTCLTADEAGQHAFLFDQGKYSIFDFPGSQGTTALGINSLGEIVGSGFVESAGVFTS